MAEEQWLAKRAALTVAPVKLESHEALRDWMEHINGRGAAATKREWWSLRPQ
jgi:hypothetical protein